jgi:hypothetical protein
MMDNRELSVQKLISEVENYFEKLSINDKYDVIRYKKEVLAEIVEKPHIALINIPRILEESFRNIAKEIQKNDKNNGKKGKKDKDIDREAGLSDLISVIESNMKIYRGILDCMNHIRAIRNSIQHSASRYDEKSHFEAFNCAIMEFHILVWKYECLENGKSDEPPTSLNDRDLLIGWYSAIVRDMDNLVRAMIDWADKPKLDFTVDTLAISAFKAQIHALAESIVQEALERSARAATYYPHDAFTMLIPLVCNLRWKRGYLVALDLLLMLPKPSKRLGDFKCVFIDSCTVNDGILSAEKRNNDEILIKLDEYDALVISGIPNTEMDVLSNFINNYGRLGIPVSGRLSLLERLKDIEIRDPNRFKNNLNMALFRNRLVLIPLIARFGIPDGEWILPIDKTMPKVGQSLSDNILPEDTIQSPEPETSSIDNRVDIVEDIFIAQNAFQPKKYTWGEDSTDISNLNIEEIERLLETYRQENTTEDND